MSSQSCSACNDLREYAPEFVVNGVTDNVAENLIDNVGLSGAENHTDCGDLLDANDCLIANMRDELDSYDVCEWKDFMGEFIPNMYETLKAMIYSQCGQWSDIMCLTKKMDLVTFAPVVKAFRGGGTGHDVVYTTLHDNTDVGVLTVYMDADENSTSDQSANGIYGSTPADRDYMAFVTWCADGQTLGGDQCSVQVSVRNNEQSQSYGNKRAQHFSVRGVTHLSTNQTGFCFLPKGGHLLIRSHCSDAPTGGTFRVHQFSMVLIPIINTDIECE